MDTHILMREWRSEANLVLTKVEGSVDVFHKAVTENPNFATEVNTTAYESTNTLTRSLPRLSEIKATKPSQRSIIGRSGNGHTLLH